MKHLKKYEEFDWQSISLWPAIGMALGHLLAKYGGKYLLNKKRRDYFNKSMKDDLYTRGRWDVKEEGNLININKKMFNGEIKPRYILDKQKREFTFISDTYPLSIKLSKPDMDNMVNDLKWINEVSESIFDLFDDLKDEGFEVDLRSTDFTKRGITVVLHRKERREDYAEYEIDPEFDEIVNQHRMASEPGEFNVLNYIEQIEDFISKVCGIYGVKIDDLYKENRIYYTGMSDETVLKSKDIDNLKNNIKNQDLLNVEFLVIPFIRK